MWNVVWSCSSLHQVPSKIFQKSLRLTKRTLNRCIISIKYNKGRFRRIFDLQSGHEINGLSLSNVTKGDNAKIKKGRVFILIRNTSSGPVLHFCQVPSKYSKGYSSYRVDEKSISNKTKGGYSKSMKARVVILVHDTSSGPILHFYQVS